jgi:serine/threonine-protein kinase
MFPNFHESAFTFRAALHRMHAIHNGARRTTGRRMAHPEWRFSDRYEVLEGIGSGASGAVWRARDLRTGADCAVKALRPELVMDAVAVSRFYTVLAAISTLHHPNILAADEVVAREGQLALVSRLVRGESLMTLLYRNGPMPPAIAAQIMAQLCDALAAAHAVGIAHGNLKPANVIVESVADGFPTVYVSDFGIAHLVRDMAMPPAEYRAPELPPGAPATLASDIYAVGIILYEVLSGRPPFVGLDPAVIAELHQVAQPPSIPGLPNPLWLPIAACLDKNPQHRPSASELAALLRDVGPLSDPVPLPRRETGDEPTRAFGVPGPVPDLPTAVFHMPQAGIDAPTTVLNVAALDPSALDVSAPGMLPLNFPTAGLDGPVSAAEMPTAGSGAPTAILDSALIDRALASATMALTSGAMMESAGLGARRTAEPVASVSGGRRRRSRRAEFGIGALIVVVGIVAAALVENSGRGVAPGGPAKIVAAPAPTGTITAGLGLIPGVNASASPTSSPSPSVTADNAPPVAPSPTSVATSPQGQITITWHCQSSSNNIGIRKTSCIGLGTDHMLYGRGDFDSTRGVQMQTISVSLIDANTGNIVDNTVTNCNGSPCTLVTGPFGPPSSTYFVTAGVNADNNTHNQDSPSISYP